MQYFQNKTTKLTNTLFENPTSEYRGAPFWAWNTRLDLNEIKEQIGYFSDMGMGGFHMHCRTGLDTEYLGEDFFDYVNECVKEAKKRNLHPYLYDEDRWPSGFAGGKVTKDVQYRSRYLVLTKISNEERVNDTKVYSSSAGSQANGHGRLIARYSIQLEKGFLKDYHRLPEREQCNDCWYLYLEIAEKSPWFNNETYVDTLNPKATKRFIEVTHEKYYENLKNDFGKTVPSIFTDEPQFTTKTFLETSEQHKDVLLPYTDQFAKIYEEKYQANFFDTLPEIIWEVSKKHVSLARYRYHDAIAELFAASYADILGKWCEEHHINLTGHVMEEPTLQSQTHSTREAMRSYRSFQLPGIDMLCDFREYSTAKQAQSASHQYGREGVMSELYGVTNWDFDFRSHKLQGDWQAALGVTFRVPHLSWMSMAGEAKRDYPASIFYQSPWYKEYKTVEDHFARVNTALTRGKAIEHIGVIHPIESYWLHFGPLDKTGIKRDELELNFKNITEWLLFAQQDFDYISESLLPDLYCMSKDQKFHIGEMSYDTVIVPACETLRKSTYEALKEFSKIGGKVIFMGTPPQYLDAVSSDEVAKLAQSCTSISFTQYDLLNELEDIREVEIRKGDGTYASNLLYQMRQDGDVRWLFIANGRPTENKDLPRKEQLTIRLNGKLRVELYDTLTGNIQTLPIKYDGKYTEFKHNFYDQDSLLLKLTIEAKKVKVHQEEYNKRIEVKKTLLQKMPVKLSEPNVLLLDMAEYRLDDGKWQAREEILRIDNNIREILGLPLRMEAFAQPWLDHEIEKPQHQVTLRFHIESIIDIKSCQFAMEGADKASITLNNKPVNIEVTGYFVDKSIQRCSIGNLHRGTNILEISMPFIKKTNLEWCYLLGDFGVTVVGSETMLGAPVNTLVFGDYTRQGLPFYAGNVVYEVDVETEDGEFELAATKFRAPLLKVTVDGQEKGQITFSPYQIALGHLSEGQHHISITSFGNRVNAFGTVHNCNEQETWPGPNAWRTTDNAYSYEYQLKNMGILKAPVLIKKN